MTLAIDTIFIIFDSIYVEVIDDWLTYELSRDTLLHFVCENPGCTDPVADNYDPYAELGGLCTSGGPCRCSTFDGYTYAAVFIRDQCWFSENLRTNVYTNGSAILEVTDNNSWFALSLGARCDYNYNGIFSNAGDYGFWWSSSPYGGNAWFRVLYDFDSVIFQGDNTPRFGFSVRCLRNAE